MPLQKLPLESQHTRRLLLEDFVLLPPLTNVSILVSEDHATYQETFSKVMHCYEAVVLTNPQLSI